MHCFFSVERMAMSAETHSLHGFAILHATKISTNNACYVTETYGNNILGYATTMKN